MSKTDLELVSVWLTDYGVKFLELDEFLKTVPNSVPDNSSDHVWKGFDWNR